MKLDYLKTIASSISADIAKDGLSCAWHYLFDGKWYELNSKTEPPTSLISPLNKSKTEPVAHHASKSKTAWFYLENENATISIDFTSSPILATRQNYRKRIEETKKHAINAFKVTHHELTGLLSRDAFRDRLRISIDDLNKTPPKGFVLQSEGQSLTTVNVLAFDIDKFKQVNDTYGHIYGDQVLKVFAWRLEAAAQRLEEEFSGRAQIHLGHPSGEEFLALVLGQISTDELRLIAERFRQSIADEHLPSDKEWGQLSNAVDLSKVRFPHKTERTVTTSVGVVSYMGGSSSDSNPLVLLDKADVALYKSKSGGRNRVTLFEEILQQCGTVLQHDTSTGVVAVDIGSKVGVLVGQEFRVYPPTFCGKTAFTVDDGRSRKTLGIYPKIELCRIVIFNTQNDIGFAYVSSPSSQGKLIEPGAMLEAVPLGQITHLVERPDLWGHSGFNQDTQIISGGKELHEKVESLVTNSKHPFSAAFRFKNEDVFYQKYGSAALNKALAQLFSILRSKFFDGQQVGIIDRTTICVVGDAATFNKDAIDQLLSEKYPKDEELNPICGYFAPTGVGEDHGAEEQKLDKHAIDLARYALSDQESFKDIRIQPFTTEIAERILAKHRQLRNFAAGIADYLRLKEIGIKSAFLENNGGLCYSATDDLSSSIECYLRAVELAPDNIILRGNVAVIAVLTNQTDLGLQQLAEIPAAKVESLRKVHPNAYWAYAVLLAKAKEENSKFYDETLFRNIGPIACTLEGATSRPDYQLVRRAIENITSSSPQ